MNDCNFFCQDFNRFCISLSGIPSVIMGLTFLAAGTSVPDMLAALIVAKQGQGNYLDRLNPICNGIFFNLGNGAQAISSCIGSNVFDICVGLGFPWLLFMCVYQVSSFSLP